MKPDFKVVKNDPYNIEHLFKKKTVGQKIKSGIQNVFHRKTNTNSILSVNSDIKYWGGYAALFALILFVCSLPFIPHLFWVVTQLAGSLCGFIVFGKIYQYIQYRKSLGYGKKFDSYSIPLSIIAAIFFLLPYFIR